MGGSASAERAPRPVRTCIGCRLRAPQSELTRIVRLADGSLAVGRQHPGRGAWLCRDRAECFRQAIKRRAFGRALRAPVASVEAERLAAILYPLGAGRGGDSAVGSPTRAFEPPDLGG